jgi:hypothetical protein
MDEEGASRFQEAPSSMLVSSLTTIFFVAYTGTVTDPVGVGEQA